MTTTYYYLGDRRVAQRKGTTVSYIHQDHLTGTSVISSSGGAQTDTIKYKPYGSQRSSTGTIPTDKRFTGQRLDSTGLYYYGARYYDPTIGRFINADTVVPSPANPQTLNRYSYVLNNPLKYNDPFGLQAILNNLTDWGFNVDTGLPYYRADEAFSSGGIYGGQFGFPIPYNEETTIGGPPAQPGQAMVAWVQEAIARETERHRQTVRKYTVAALQEREGKEVRQLATLYARLKNLKAEIEEEVEVLSLRRAFPGRCRLCPV